MNFDEYEVYPDADTAKTYVNALLAYIREQFELDPDTFEGRNALIEARVRDARVHVDYKLKTIEVEQGCYTQHHFVKEVSVEFRPD